MRWVIGLALLAFQLAAIVYARFVPSRYFCWAPFDMQTAYTAEVRVNGRTLPPAEVLRRYRRPARGFDNRSVQHVIDIFQQTEQRYHPADRTEVTLRYRVNGHPEQTWRWATGTR